MARDNDIFKFKRSVKKDEVIPAQAQVILKLIHDAGSISRADLVAKLTKELSTKQPVERVLSFYRSPLVNGGFVTIEPGEKPEVTKKPKAEKKAAAKKPAKKAAPKKASKKPAKKKAPASAPEASAIDDSGDQQPSA